MSNKTMTLSASKINCYLSCQKKYEFQYKEGLIAPKSEALQTGIDYHEEVADILLGKGEPISPMGHAFKKYIDRSGWKIKAVEEEFNIPLSHGVKLRGFIDGLVEIDGKQFLLEHKTTGMSIDEQYEDRLRWDRQIPIYCKSTGIYDVLYTVVKKPTIRKKKETKNKPEESDEEFFQRCIEWYEEDTEKKIKLFQFRRLKSEVEEATSELSELAKEMRGRKIFHRDNSSCKIMGCPFKSICLNYNPQCVVGFEKKTTGE